MKVTFVTDTYTPQPNGVATTLSRLVEGLRENGHDVDVVRPSILASNEDGLEVPSLGLPGYPEVRFGFPMRTALQARWRRNRPDVIYVATETLLGASAISAARALGIPAASGFHTNFQQYMAHYEMPILEKAVMNYLRRLHNRSTCTFVPSPDVIARLSQAGFQNLELLPKGVDTKLFNPSKCSHWLRQSWGASPGSKVGLYVGRMAAEKNLPLVVKTFTEIRKRFPDFVGVFVGDGPKLEALRKTHPEFIYTGVLRGESLAEHYASADLFIFPSLTETFGNVTLEAMASGLSVVAYDYAAANQHIVDGINGYRARFDDVDHFIARAVEAVSAPDSAMVREAARRSARKTRWKKVIRRFEKQLRRLIQPTGETTSREVGLPRGHSSAHKKKKEYETVFISDVHLGTRDCKAEELVGFLRSFRCRKLILNGDIIDGWALRSRGKWLPSHTNFVRAILNKIEKDGTQIIYLRGNHDDVIERFLPLELGGLKLVNEYVHETPQGKYLVVHGDGFDSLTTNFQWVAVMGAKAYEWLLVLNRLYNRFRAFRGKEYFSLSRHIKERVKSAVTFVGRYEDQLTELASVRQCVGIICGHIHTPANKRIGGGIHYLNSGDWVESLTAVIESEPGNFELFHYRENPSSAEHGETRGPLSERSGTNPLEPAFA